MTVSAYSTAENGRASSVKLGPWLEALGATKTLLFENPITNLYSVQMHLEGFLMPSAWKQQSTCLRYLGPSRARKALRSSIVAAMKDVKPSC